jgi:hypothetical protein
MLNDNDNDVPGPEQEAALKTEIISLWKQRNQCDAALPPLLYKLCKALHAPGKKGQGFDAWLKEAGISHTTAYRWIEKYAKRNGLPLPFVPKAKPNPEPLQPEPEESEATLSHVVQTLPMEAQQQSSLELESTPPQANSGPQDSITDIVARMHMFDRIKLLGMGTLEELLHNADLLVEKPSAEYAVPEMEFYDPAIHDMVYFGEPGYEWTQEDVSLEIDKATAYKMALNDTLKVVTNKAKQMRKQLKAIDLYVSGLLDGRKPKYRVVPKKKTVEGEDSNGGQSSLKEA